MNASFQPTTICFIRYSDRVTYPLSHPSVNGRSVGHDIPITVISDIASTIRTDNGSIKQYDHYTIIGSAVSSVHAANKRVFFHTKHYVSRKVTTYVIVCHHVTYNSLFHNSIYRRNFASTTERTPLRGFPEAEE
ncbi:hypothetical protein QMY64_16445 [Phocaeicola dorei]|nr:hypothetical protein QMY64_16445 [Phocaeicola dorei]